MRRKRRRTVQFVVDNDCLRAFEYKDREEVGLTVSKHDQLKPVDNCRGLVEER